MKAIDIALLLPYDREQYIQEVNHSQPVNERQYTYTDDGPYPHISLCMVGMSDYEIQYLAEMISGSGILNQTISIRTGGLKTYKRPDDTRYYIDIQKSSELVRIQNQVLELCKQYFARRIDRSMYINPDEVSKSSVLYCKNYSTMAAGKNFHPHLSLGKGKPSYEINDFECRCTRLVIGHMGPSGTVRKILYEFIIGE